MELIRKRCKRYVFLLTFNICLVIWFSEVDILEAVFVFGMTSVNLLVLLLRESRILKGAKLIWDNRIIVVPSVLISIPGRKMKKDNEETVVSTFGILIGSQIYRWGISGIYGVKLHKVFIDKEMVYLTFGDDVKTMKVELLHGMTSNQEVEESAEKFYRETGVQVEIIDWK